MSRPNHLPIAALSLSPWFLLCLLSLPGCSEPSDPPGITTSLVNEVQDAPSVEVRAEDWPWWRGPTFNGKSVEQEVPLKWDENTNVVWKSPVPGRGHSTPAVWGERLFLSTAENDSQSLLCYDRRTGAPLWSQPIHTGNFQHTHRKNSQASATPACDGQRVYVPFVNGEGVVLSATDLGGKILWQKKLGDYESEHGYGSSPVIHGNLVIVAGDSLRGSFIAGVERERGLVVWTINRKDGPSHGNYATPIVGKVAGRSQLLIPGKERVDAYDPLSGQLLWFARGLSQVAANTVSFDGDLVYASGGYPEKALLCIRADGEGDVTDSHVVWREKRAITYVPSPLAHNGRLYLVNDKGIASCYNSTTGERIWQERVDGQFTASPTLVGDHLYCPDEDGTTHVLKAADQFEVVASNPLGDGIFASPVICGGQIFLRTHQHLYCIGKKG